jgi:FkbM family methyltransferase
VRLNGVLLELGPHVTPDIRKSIYAERYERGEARSLTRKLEAGDVVLEIGAGIGFLSTLCALRIGSDRVFTYEANPALIEVIKATYALNGVKPTLTHGTVAGKAGTTEFFVDSEFVSSSLIRLSDDVEAVEIPVFDVNAEIARISPTTVVMDIEGAEHDLVPIIDWSTIARVVIDIHPEKIGERKAAEVAQMLVDAGFTEDRWLSGTRKKTFER